MKVVKDEKLKQINGGFSAWVGVGIAAAIVFLSGVIEGITNPRRCNG